MNPAVLSRTSATVPSGTENACDQGPLSRKSPCHRGASASSNFPNQESFGFLLTDPQSTSRQSPWLSSQPTACANLRTTAAELRVASWKWIFAILDLQERYLLPRRAWRSDAAVSAEQSCFARLSFAYHASSSWTSDRHVSAPCVPSCDMEFQYE